MGRPPLRENSDEMSKAGGTPWPPERTQCSRSWHV